MAAGEADRAAGARRRVVAGLLGRGIQASRTPGMHEAEGARLGLDYRYRLLDFDLLGLDDGVLPETIAWAARHGFAGLNVTHPFKESVTAWLDALAPEAAAIGAVNTIVLRDGRSTGHNTDCWGFAESFRRGMAEAGRGRVVLIGAGGAGAAVARALLGLGVERLDIHDVDGAKAARLAFGLAAAFGESRAAAAADLEAAVTAADGLVNATPVGMAKYPGMPIAPASLRREQWVADIVYFPRETQLLRKAREAGCRTLSGTGMAVFQAVRAFELISGVVPDAGQMARHFDEA
ncbi:MAG TPA: shikimate dehydrogenase [Afifellaceae bacterium]|nr:shikimate dehydrogenase [Afifellaceae bacterium]